MKSRRAKFRDDDRLDDDRADEDAVDERRPRKRRRAPRADRKRRKLPWLLLLVLAVVALAPTIVAKTPLRNMILAAALPSDQVRATVGSASLSWISAPSFSDVRVTDAAGQLLLSVESVRLDRGPASLLLDSTNLGRVEIIRPALYVQLRADGNNIEDALREILARSGRTEVDPAVGDTSITTPVVSLHVEDGTILAADAETGRRWRVQSIAADFDTSSTPGSVGQGRLSATVVDLGANDAAIGVPGNLQIELGAADGRQKLTIEATALSLGMADAVLRRYVSGTQFSGMLAGRAAATWTASAAAFPADLSTDGTFAVEQLDATAPGLAGDHIRLALVEVPWRIAAQPDGLKVELLQLRSDVGQMAVRGVIDPRMFGAASGGSQELAGAAASQPLEVRGSLDLQRIAAMLPHALRIRSDTTITSGQIQLEARTQPADGGQLITGSVQTAQLAATSAGRPIRWDQPVSVNFAVRRQQAAWRLDSLQCDSDFLKVAASGTPQQFTAAANFDLNRLGQQLGQFLDLSGMGLAGTGSAKLNWNQTSPDQFAATASGVLSQLRIALGNGTEWTEPQLELEATASGAVDATSHRPTRVDAARLAIHGNGDELDARLTSPVALDSAAPSWPLKVAATGSVSRWLARVRPWFAPDPWQIDGQSELAATIQIAGSVVETTNANLAISDLRATAPGWNIREPQTEFTGDARYDLATGAISSRSAQLVTSTVSLAAQGVNYQPGLANASQLAGVAAFRTDLGRLAAMRASGPQGSNYRTSGEMEGNIRFANEGGRLVGQIAATGKNLSLAQLAPPRGNQAAGYQTIWAEPQLTLQGLAAYDAGNDRVGLEQFQIQSNTLQVSAGGRIERVSTAADVELNGTVQYDLAQITPLLRPYLGDGIRLNGREQAQFALAGALNDPAGVSVQPVGFSNQAARDPQAAYSWSRRVRAQVALPWSGADVYGLPVGAGKLSAALGNGAIRIEPISLAVGEGRLTASPHVRLDPSPAELTLPQGPLITNVRISPEVSNTMLKFVAPVLAGATQSEGLFSLSVDGARVPLQAPKQADARGQLTVHSVRVVPGPMAQQWVSLAQQIESIARRKDAATQNNRQPVTLLAVKDQQVNFRVADGRVYHQNMEFQVGDVQLRSEGSVGLDETVSLTLHVPIQEAWISQQPLLSGLRGQSLAIPISGTLTRPQMDQRAISGLTQQLLQGAAQQAIGGELNKALDKLFKQR